MKIISARRRKGISPVLATVILIAITLIAAIAIAGFVFGLFGTFTSSARLQSSVVACHATGGGSGAGLSYCLIDISNTGGASGSVTGCSIYGTTEVTNSALNGGGTATVTITAGTPAPGTAVYCIGTAAQITAGSAVSGSLVVASGSPLAFSAVAST